VKGWLARHFDVLVELYRLLSPWRRQLALTGVAVLVSTGASLVPPYIAAKAIDDGIVKGDLEALDIALIVLVVAVVLYAITSAVETYSSAWVAQRALASLRSRIFGHLQVLSPGFYDRSQTGDLVSRVTNDVEQLENLVAGSLAALAGSILAVVGTLVAMFLLDVELALVALWVFPATFAAMAVWGRLARPRFRRTRDTIGALSGDLQETLGGIKLVRSFGQERRHRERFRTLNSRDGQAQISTKRIAFALAVVMWLLPALGVTAILIFGGLQVSDGSKPVGVVVAFVAYFQRLLSPLAQLTSRDSGRPRSPAPRGAARAASSRATVSRRPGPLRLRRAASRDPTRDR
jgi:ABC-type multidrug transport system fused ATPase/permease subunit